MTGPQLVAGAAITPRVVPLSLQRLVMEAGVNRDFAPIHHDVDEARKAGAPGPFTNFVFLQSLVEFTLRAWAGPSARIERIAFKLGGFNAVGMTLTCSGTIVEAVRDAGGVVARIAITIEAAGRVTSTGECEVRFPTDTTAKQE